MKVLVVGALGQLGQELQRCVPGDVALIGVDRDEMDICEERLVHDTIAALAPDLLINVAAYTAVDAAESDREAAFAINSLGARHIALAAREHGCRLIHISTDFVFDGSQGRPYRTDDEARPLSTYGRSKLDGEEEVTTSGAEYVVVRTSWLYSRFGGNFVKTMLRLMKERSKLAVVDDQVGCPTWAGSFAEALWEIGRRLDITGTIHWTDAGVASWYDFAVAVQEIALDLGLLDTGIQIEPIASAAYPTPAARPPYSVLDTTATRELLKTQQLHWREALRRMLEGVATGNA